MKFVRNILPQIETIFCTSPAVGHIRILGQRVVMFDYILPLEI